MDSPTGRLRWIRLVVNRPVAHDATLYPGAATPHQASVGGRPPKPEWVAGAEPRRPSGVTANIGSAIELEPNAREKLVAGMAATITRLLQAKKSAPLSCRKPGKSTTVPSWVLFKMAFSTASTRAASRTVMVPFAPVRIQFTSSTNSS